MRIIIDDDDQAEKSSGDDGDDDDCSYDHDDDYDDDDGGFPCRSHRKVSCRTQQSFPESAIQSWQTGTRLRPGFNLRYNPVATHQKVRARENPIECLR